MAEATTHDKADTSRSVICYLPLYVKLTQVPSQVKFQVPVAALRLMELESPTLFELGL